MHVRGRNDIAFTPFGLDVLPKLGTACKEVQKRLDADRKRLSANEPQFLKTNRTRPNTAVGKLIRSLDRRTDLAEVDRLSSLSEEELNRLNVLPAQLASDPKKRAAELRARAKRIAGLQTTLTAARAALSDEPIDKLRTQANETRRKSDAADAAAKLAFGDEPLPNVGDAVWKELWEAARRFSGVAYPDQPFPVASDDAVCVLCQQPLSDEAQQRLSRFEDFVEDDLAAQAKAAGNDLDRAKMKIESLALRQRAAREHLEDLKLVDATLHNRVREELGVLLRRYRVLLATFKSGAWDFDLASYNAGGTGFPGRCYRGIE